MRLKRADTFANYPKWWKYQATPVLSSDLQFLVTKNQASFSPSDDLPYCFLTEDQVLTSSKTRTGKQTSFKLPDPSAHRPVGRFCSDVSHILYSEKVTFMTMSDKSVWAHWPLILAYDVANIKGQSPTGILNISKMESSVPPANINIYLKCQ